MGIETNTNITIYTAMTDLQMTLTGLAFCAIVGTFSFFRHFKKTEKYKAPIIPWIIPAMACIATGFMLIVHLVNLMGIETGGRI